MRRTILPAFVAAGVLLSPPALPAQDAALDGVRYVVPQGFSPEPSHGDATLAVLSQPSTGFRLFVATLAPGAVRAETVERIRARLAGTIPPGRSPLQWRWAASFPASRFEVYHERHLASTGKAGLAVEIRHLRFQGRDVLAGYSHPLSEADAARVLQESRVADSEPAREGAARLIGSLLGEGPPPSLLPPVGRPSAPSPEAPRVRAVYEAYRDALASNDGEAAARLVSEPTLEYFAEILRLARSSSDEELKAQPMLNRMLALRVRGHVTPERLRTMSAREFFALTVTDVPTGVLTGNEEPATRSVGEVAVLGDVAVAMITQAGTQIPPVAFVRHEGGWRLDLLFHLPFNGANLERAAKRSGLPEDAFLLPYLSAPMPFAKTPEEARAAYVAEIDRELASLERFGGTKFRVDADALVMEAVLFGSWASMIHEAGTHMLSDAEKSRVEDARRMISAVQVREFPEMRAAYARIVGERMREFGITATVAGVANDTLRLTGRRFGRKAFVELYQERVQDVANLLRFRRVEYRSNGRRNAVHTYDLEPSADGVILRFTDTGSVPVQ